MIKKNLAPPSNNAFTSFLPLRTKDKHYKFCWDSVLGYLVHILYSKSLFTKNVYEFKGLCEKNFSKNLESDDSGLWDVIEKMYFQNDELFKISPEFLIFKAAGKEIDANSKKLGDMYAGVLNGFTVESSSVTNLNFLEREIKSEFDKFHVSGKKTTPKEFPTYLPFISEYFKKDLHFLNKKPHYLISNFNAVIRLYGFLYISQMALSINNWACGEPKSEPCFFILDNEKASEERSQVKNCGYDKIRDHLEYLYPYLFMNEALQEKNNVQPLWKLFDEINDSHIDGLNNFGEDFIADRTERKWYNTELNWQRSEDKKNVLAQLLEASHSQFHRRKGRLSTYSNTAVKGTLLNILDPFIQNRKRGGNVLAFNQDYIVLLTNLVIGEREKLRFHEVIKEFEARGVYFDKQSQQNLVDFYERMGNVVRMSDSGDAVYVRPTV
ncbi:DNA phosphorothioation-dependent restriction protein DptG [Enterovibrio norvegicus]|uniref:DNA phosphorothioation-dependent restriction protein DptG n=1 Tax=Enterovibrio norvegicus DSM 15893 TaxID=1121869 RepID=A0A1I5TDY6_9GAMM|nr:DNA phosphorothioation-dependent restriction protein DptG [Enterovibrio norvegicus]SFP81178.1 DNA phosphorothioation-dependent restriction protein DptG [Enterovibrio norvegicus DSM 15893]